MISLSRTPVVYERAASSAPRVRDYLDSMREYELPFVVRCLGISKRDAESFSPDERLRKLEVFREFLLASLSDMGRITRATAFLYKQLENKQLTKEEKEAVREAFLERSALVYSLCDEDGRKGLTPLLAMRGFTSVLDNAKGQPREILLARFQSPSLDWLSNNLFEKLLLFNYEKFSAAARHFSTIEEPVLRKRFLQKVAEAIRRGDLPISLKSATDRISTSEVFLVEPICNVGVRGSAYQIYRRGFITSGLTEKEKEEVYSHERVHLLSGMSFVLGRHSDGEIKILSSKKGLTFPRVYSGIRNSDSKEAYEWLNEGVTQIATMKILFPFDNMESGTLYHSEQKLVRLLANGARIPISYFLRAYFEDEHSRGKSHWGLLTQSLGRAFGQDCLAKLEKIIKSDTENGLARAIEYLKGKITA